MPPGGFHRMLARLIRIHSLLAVLATMLALRLPAHAADQDETESDTEEEAGEGSADAADPNQPSVYSGGRYTIVNFPVSELDRTLTLVQGVLELRADLGILMDRGATFDIWALLLQGRYGISD